MPRSSDSVAALGCALAKAQAELVNPEKSLTATVWTRRAGEGQERSFRYASLASGLDIVRKTLGQHEIATVQTTAVDPVAGLVNLTTMLVHASGEWIASDWPVCPISDLASPRRMGAALTYARRYALFTLVGIAGEDDLDATALQDQAHRPSQSSANGTGNGTASENGSGAGHLNKTPSTPAGSGDDGRGRPGSRSMPSVILAPDQSAELRDRFMAEIADITSSEQAKHWARKALPAKNTLTVVDAQAIEQAFEQRVTEFSEAADIEAELPSIEGQGSGAAQSENLNEFGGQHRSEEPDGIVTARGPIQPGVALGDRSGSASHLPTPGIDKSVLTLSEPKRHRNKEHLQFVAQQPCLICGRTPSDPHHLRFAQQRALGRKVSDEFVVPLCRSHHRVLHRVGNERGWWQATGIDPLDVASKLWGQSRMIEQAESVPVKAAPELLGAKADGRPGNASPNQTRPPAKRSSKRSGRVAANGRMP